MANDHRGVRQLRIQDIDQMYNVRILMCPFFSFKAQVYDFGIYVKIMEHTPILKLNQLNLLSCCYFCS